jgi:hypothetical protein
MWGLTSSVVTPPPLRISQMGVFNLYCLANISSDAECFSGYMATYLWLLPLAIWPCHGEADS